MCYERWLKRREQAEESSELWREFDRTRPLADPEVHDEDPAPTEAREEAPAVTER